MRPIANALLIVFAMACTEAPASSSSSAPTTPATKTTATPSSASSPTQPTESEREAPRTDVEASVTYAQVVAAVRDGDVIFQESRSKQSEAIRQATGSRYTHVGLVFGAGTDAPHVLEAVQPVRRTPLGAWIKRGEGAHFVLMRLRDRETQDITALERAAEQFLGRNYDATFDWSDERIYCSELVWKAYDRAAHIRLGDPEPWSALNLNATAAKQLANQRLGHQPNPNALVVTPVRVMQSDLLERVMTARLE